MLFGEIFCSQSISAKFRNELIERFSSHWTIIVYFQYKFERANCIALLIREPIASLNWFLARRKPLIASISVHRIQIHLITQIFTQCYHAVEQI